MNTQLKNIYDYLLYYNNKLIVNKVNGLKFKITQFRGGKNIICLVFYSEIKHIGDGAFRRAGEIKLEPGKKIQKIYTLSPNKIERVSESSLWASELLESIN